MTVATIPSCLAHLSCNVALYPRRVLQLQPCRYIDLAGMADEPSTSKSTEVRLIPMPDIEDEPMESSSNSWKGKWSPPAILRRRRNHPTQRTDTPDSGNHSDYILGHQAPGDAAPSTPIKQLPFSPSQFLNSLSPETWPRSSTPKSGNLTTLQPRANGGLCWPFNVHF